MSWIDLLRMSASNLKRRRASWCTFLTVLGVVIGTASIGSHGVSWTWTSEISL